MEREEEEGLHAALVTSQYKRRLHRSPPVTSLKSWRESVDELRKWKRSKSQWCVHGLSIKYRASEALLIS